MKVSPKASLLKEAFMVFSLSPGTFNGKICGECVFFWALAVIICTHCSWGITFNILAMERRDVTLGTGSSLGV